MKNWLLSLLIVLGSARAFSQQDYFIYLQADNHQLFYVRLNNKVYSSTESGYLILPRLADSSYRFIIGFPANAFPEQYFTLSVNHKDAGYLVKNFGDKGWGLFNIQLLAVIMNSNPSVEKKSPELNVTKKSDLFSTLLANAVNDTSILYASNRPAPVMATVKEQPRKDSILQALPQEVKTDTMAVAKNIPSKIDSSATAKNEPPVKTDTFAPVINTAKNAIAADSTAKDTIAAASTTAVIKSPATDSMPAAVNTAPPVVYIPAMTLKVAELLTDTSYIAVFTDGTPEKHDTIRVSIPLDKPGILIAEAQPTTKVPVYNMPDTARQKDSAQAPAIISPVPGKRNPIAVNPKKTAADSDNVNKPGMAQAGAQGADTLHTAAPAKPVIPNSTCTNLAWDSDIDKLRVKMLAVKIDDDKIAIAKKLFKQKCLTVKQIRALNELFVTDEGKYKWFDAAYASASDAYNYSQLEDLIKDSYYQGRFKALIRK